MYPGTPPEGPIAWLRRRAPPNPPPSAPRKQLIDAVVALGTDVPIPQEPRRLWARISIRPTRLGQLVQLLYKLPPLELTLKGQGGQTETFHFIAGMGEAGFLLSPIVRDTRGFVALFSPDWASTFSNERPTAFRLSGGSGTRFLWQPTYHISVATGG